MRSIDRNNSALLVIDMQEKLIPAITGAQAVTDNIQRLCKAAALLDIPVTFTEQNSKGLGPTLDDLQPSSSDTLLAKMSFDASREAEFLEKLRQKSEIIIVGCEAHVCVLQSVLGLLDTGCKIFVVSDGIGSRTDENKQAGINRMQHHGAEIVSTEMVLFEWIQDANHPQFRDILALVK